MFAARREALLETIGKGVVVLPSPPAALRNNDVEHEYRQGSDLYYLSGFDEPESVLILSNAHASHRAVLFLRERDPDRETWDGPRLGVERAPEQLGVDAAFPIRELDARLPDYLENTRRVHYRIGLDRGFDERFLRALDSVRVRARRGIECPSEIVDPAASLHEMRLRKSAEEVASMRRAAAVTRDSGRPLPEREKQAETWAQQAVTLLRRAAAAGHFGDAANRSRLEKDDALAFLRGREDFRTFLKTLPAVKPPSPHGGGKPKPGGG